MTKQEITLNYVQSADKLQLTETNQLHVVHSTPIRWTCQIGLAVRMLLPQNPSDDEILRFVEAWIDDLARDDFVTAFLRTDHDPYYQWTPDLLRSVVQGYGLPEPHRSGTIFNITPRASAQGGPPQRIVDRVFASPNSFAEVWYDLPLNGVWSDLTATFRIEQRDNRSAVVLQEIHVF